MLTAMSGAIVNIVLNFLLIPRFGAVGAAVATLASYATVFVIRAIDTRSLLKFDMHIVRLAFNTALLVSSSIVMLTIQSTTVLYIIQAFFVSAILTVNAAPLIKGVKALLAK